jgi:hypothetical protein
LQNLSKRKQLSYRGRKHPAKVGVLKEEGLQKQLNDMLNAHGIWFIRIPDGIFRWMKMNAPMGVQRWFFGLFGGIPDCIPLIKVSDKYMLCCPIELKSKTGQRHGKQKHWETKGIPFQISRTPEKNIEIVEQFIKDANQIAHKH